MFCILNPISWNYTLQKEMMFDILVYSSLLKWMIKMNALYCKTLCTILWLDTEYFSKCCRSTEYSMHKEHLHTVYIIHSACWYAILGSLQKKIKINKKLYSRHFLKHFDFFTALWRLPFEHVAVVGFWRRGELRQRRTAAAVCRKKLQISNYFLDYYQSWESVQLSWYNTANYQI